MLPHDTKTEDRAVGTSLSFFQRLFGDYHPRDFAIRLWDGTTWEAEPGQTPRFRLVFNHPGALRRMFWPPNEVTLGKAYIYDDFNIEGECEGIFALADHILSRKWGLIEKLRYGKSLLSLPSDDRPQAGRREAELSGAQHSRERDQQAIAYHYDVSNDFFGLWLDDRMAYSCAYFASPDDDLNAAQERKLDYICRKLRLKRGERLLDIGCGWGGLVIYAAQNYGVNALGITLSQPQADLAAQKIHQAGLGDRCRVAVVDYREIDEKESFDKLVSVGMFEHVGESKLPEYFQQAHRLLRPGGVFLNHGIACRATEKAQRGPTFSDRYVFPDSELLPINTTLRIAENSGFEVRDLESLREHYMLTLRHWVRRLEKRHREALQATDEATYRVWRLFMSGSAYGFKVGLHNVYQALLIKSGQCESGLPLTRDDWYA